MHCGLASLVGSLEIEERCTIPYRPLLASTVKDDE